MWKRINKNMVFRRSLLQQLDCCYCDLRYGFRLLSDEKESPFFKEGCYHTQSIEYEELSLIFKEYELNKNDAIMDVGCGRGRLFNYLLKKKFKGMMYGVEIDSEIGLFTKKRLIHYHNIEIFVGNALDYVFCNITVYFLFCPFDRVWTEKFIEKIERVHTKVRIIYYYPKFVGCFLMRDGWSGEERIIYSKIRNFSLPCFYMNYEKKSDYEKGEEYNAS